MWSSDLSITVLSTWHLLSPGNPKNPEIRWVTQEIFGSQSPYRVGDLNRAPWIPKSWYSWHQGSPYPRTSTLEATCNSHWVRMAWDNIRMDLMPSPTYAADVRLTIHMGHQKLVWCYPKSLFHVHRIHSPKCTALSGLFRNVWIISLFGTMFITKWDEFSRCSLFISPHESRVSTGYPEASLTSFYMTIWCWVSDVLPDMKMVL